MIETSWEQSDLLWGVFSSIVEERFREGREGDSEREMERGKGREGDSESEGEGKGGRFREG